MGNTGGALRRHAAAAVHPHARGEHHQPCSDRPRGSGSSPRPWGTRQLVLKPGEQHRFIPTPVGNTSETGDEVRSPPVHPHARGEHSHPAEYASSAVGSSPRPWGTRHQSWAVAPAHRFIPTPVGNTDTASDSTAGLPVHPHARGEHINSMPARGDPVGSSPRPWGTRARWRCPTWPRPVHPHARGEHDATISSTG